MVRIDRREKINSLLAAAVIAETNICAITAAIITIPMVSVLLMFFIWVLCIKYNQKELYLTSDSIVAFGLFFLLLIFSMLLNGFEVPGQRLIYFFTFGATAMFVVGVKNIPGLILKYLLYIYAIHLFVYFFLQRNYLLGSEEYWYDQMGIAYGFVPPIIIGVIFLLYRRELESDGIIKRRRLVQAIAYIAIMVLSSYVILIDCATRGAILVAFVGVFFVILRKLSHKMKIVIGLASLCLLAFLFLNWNSILSNSLDSFAEGNVKALVKMSQMAGADDVSNGRETNFNIASQMIKNNPMGYGVGYYENVTKAPYVHQLFLELLLECGIFGLILFLIPIAKLIRKTYGEEDGIKYAFSVLILTCCFLPLLFSASFWLYPPFWFGYFYAIQTCRPKRKQLVTNKISSINEHSQQTANSL